MTKYKNRYKVFQVPSMYNAHPYFSLKHLGKKVHILHGKIRHIHQVLFKNSLVQALFTYHKIYFFHLHNLIIFSKSQSCATSPRVRFHDSAVTQKDPAGPLEGTLPPYPSSRWPPICFLSLLLCRFWILHRHGIIHYVVFQFGFCHLERC